MSVEPVQPPDVPPGYPREYERGLRLVDGRLVMIRPIVASDATQLAEAIRTADADTLYRRFLGGPPRLTPALLARLCTVDYQRRFALVATDPATGQGVAIARYEPLADGVAEVAVAVDPAWRRAGLATALIEMLAQAALERGIHTFGAYYLAQNQPVAALLGLADGPSRQVIRSGLAESAVALNRDRVTAAIREMDPDHEDAARLSPSRSARLPGVPPPGDATAPAKLRLRARPPAPGHKMGATTTTGAGETAEIALADAFVAVADTLNEDFDVVERLHELTERCVQLLDVTAAGVLLTDGRDTLQLAVASSEPARALERLQLQTDQGPSVACFHTGQPVSVPNLPAARRWPQFTAAAGEIGFSAVHALPMRLRTQVIGVLSLFNTTPAPLDNHTRRIGQALADVATIGLLQQRAVHRRRILAEQLQTALNSRILIEQAKGILAERLHLNMAEAFTLLRSHARNHNRRLSDLAQAIVDGCAQIPATSP